MITKAVWARIGFLMRTLLNSRVFVSAKAVNTTMSRYGNFLPLVQNEKKGQAKMVKPNRRRRKRGRKRGRGGGREEEVEEEKKRRKKK